MVAASRLLFAVARDGVSTLSKLDRTRPTTINSRGTPRTRWWSCSHLQRCCRAPLYRAIVAVTSFISANGVSTVAVYGLIVLPTALYVHSALFPVVAFFLLSRRWAQPMCVLTVLFNGLVFAVRLFLFFRINNGGFGGYFIGHGLLVLLPGCGQHI